MSVATATVQIAERAEERELASLAKALGHPARVQIVRLLLSQDACYCGEIVDELPLAQATVSQHLKVLKEAGLIRGEIDGLRMGYCADRERLAAFHQMMGALLHEAVELSGDGCSDDD
jgi:ArsR family transcriptional regulator